MRKKNISSSDVVSLCSFDCEASLILDASAVAIEGEEEEEEEEEGEEEDGFWTFGLGVLGW